MTADDPVWLTLEQQTRLEALEQAKAAGRLKTPAEVNELWTIRMLRRTNELFAVAQRMEEGTADYEQLVLLRQSYAHWQGRLLRYEAQGGGTADAEEWQLCELGLQILAGRGDRRALAELAEFGTVLTARLTTQDGERHQDVETADAPHQYGECVFKRTESGSWQMVFANQRAGVGHLEGFDLIRTLLAHPNHPFDAMTLMRRASVTSSDVKMEYVELTPTNGFAGVETFDLQAKEQYLRQIKQLQDAEVEARLRKEEGKAETYRDEWKSIEDYLGRGVDQHGQPRKIGSELERARKAASEQVSRALERIETVLPPLADHLRTAVQRGRVFVYQPRDDARWVTQ